ncbi:MAG: hypothetical protein D3917_10120 [Candidatus Electrothrix sp. AX5]|nr:hypothetical protein [Candidatus Electrothrix sp. AX5]
MELTSKSVSKRQGINCLVSYFYKNQKLVLLYEGSSPETLYNCMTNDFQKLYNDVMNAETNDEYLEKYNNFTQVYGHGCVTTLHLTAGSVFMINIGYSNDAEANSLRFGSSVSVNTPFGGGSVAGAWGKEVEASFSNATMSVTGENIPENTPTASWCSAMVDKFTNQAVSILCQPAGMISVPNTSNPKSPELPERRNPDNKKIPSPVNTDSNLTKELKDKIMKEDGYNDWNEYINAQKDAYEKTTPRNIVKDAISKIKKLNSDNILKNINNSDKEILNLHKNTDTALGSDSWNLGGYIPYAYEVTPWSVLFPDLKLKLPQSFTSIYYAKIFTYYLTRLQFAQYLYFLHDVGESLEQYGNYAISFDADIYNAHCNNLLKKLAKIDKIDEKIYTDTVKDFEESILTDNTFNSVIIYNKFYELYDFINHCQYGFVHVMIDKDNNYSYYSGDNYTINLNIRSSFNITSLLKDATRLYFFLGHNDEGWLFGFGLFTHAWMINLIGDESNKKILSINTDDRRRKYISLDDTNNNRLYFVSSIDVPESSTIRGLPMFATFPFDDIKEFANPTPAI